MTDICDDGSESHILPSGLPLRIAGLSSDFPAHRFPSKISPLPAITFDLLFSVACVCGVVNLFVRNVYTVVMKLSEQTVNMNDGHEISRLYHSLSWYTLVTLVYTTPYYSITYS